MKQTNQMGLGNMVEEQIEILHTGVLGRNAFGRIADLVAMWCEKSQSLQTRPVSDLRLMVQALLEFSHPKENAQLGQFEFAIEEQHIFASVRFENHIVKGSDGVEKTLSQFWLNSEEATMLKKVLYPKDRVEVRFNEKLNLIEWRVCRSLKPESITHHDPSFLVILDEMPALSSESKRYTDLGDLPYQDWLSAVYKNTNTENRSGEVFVKGESLQNESEWARVVVDREANEVDDEVRVGGKEQDEESVVFRELSYEENEKINEKSRRYVEELRSQMIGEQSALRENVKELVSQSKKRELRAVREAVLLQQKVDMFERLLHKKEVTIQRNQTELRILNNQISQQTETKNKGGSPAGAVQAFREKAIEMFEQLKKVKEQNTAMEKLVVELQHREKAFLFGKDNHAADTTTALKQVEELNSKIDRMQRALDSEKGKVKTLSERVIVSEREAQSAGPMVEDLERKVENTLKIAQQHKKETEAVKQKLIQAEGEKNRFKNELVKAQAQIQTLTKRHAS